MASGMKKKPIFKKKPLKGIFRSFFFKRLGAFSLIEISIVLMVIGLLAGAVFKGRDLLESARLRSVITDLERYRLNVQLYRDAYGEWPGDDPKATIRFGQTAVNGDGNGLVTGGDIPLAWQHLSLFGQSTQTEDFPTSKMGGKFFIASNFSTLTGTWLLLSGDRTATTGILTPKQAQDLKAKVDQNPPQQGDLRILDGTSQGGKCLLNQTFNLANTTPSCVVAISLN